MKEPKKKQINPKAVVSLCACLLVLAAVIGMLIVDSASLKKQQAEYDRLAQQNNLTGKQEETGADASGTGSGEAAQEEEKETSYERSVRLLEEQGIPIPEKSVDFETLRSETNPDIYAWIYLPDSSIDYPVLQHPTDNTYYLKHNLIDNGKSRPACIYSENYNSKDFTDPVTVLYGHNMSDGSMFADLHKFENEEYFDDTHYLYLYTPEKLLVYEIFAAYMTDDAHLLINNHDFKNEWAFQEYIDTARGSLNDKEDYQILEAGLKVRYMGNHSKPDVDVTIENHLLTLSTCMTEKAREDNRYLVVGVLCDEEALEEESGQL